MTIQELIDKLKEIRELTRDIEAEDTISNQNIGRIQAIIDTILIDWKIENAKVMQNERCNQ